MNRVNSINLSKLNFSSIISTLSSEDKVLLFDLVTDKDVVNLLSKIRKSISKDKTIDFAVIEDIVKENPEEYSKYKKNLEKYENDNIKKLVTKFLGQVGGARHYPENWLNCGTIDNIEDCLNHDDLDPITLIPIRDYHPDQLYVLENQRCISRESYVNMRNTPGTPLINPLSQSLIRCEPPEGMPQEQPFNPNALYPEPFNPYEMYPPHDIDGDLTPGLAATAILLLGAFILTNVIAWWIGEDMWSGGRKRLSQNRRKNYGKHNKSKKRRRRKIRKFRKSIK